MDRCLFRVAQLGRKKHFNTNNATFHETPLKKDLSTFNLFFLCLGETLGYGIFLVNGFVSKEVAGPGAFLSYILAGIIIYIPGACYMEFASKLPRCGSAYAYVYATIGEFVAFLIGWNLVLEFILRAISMAQICSYTIDYLSGNFFENFIVTTFQHGIPWHHNFFVRYPDVLGCLCVVSSMIIVYRSTKLTVQIVMSLLSFKLIVVGFCLYLGVISIEHNKLNLTGKFLPYGMQGVVGGILPCYFAMSAFNTLGTLSEEAINSRKSIPLAAMIFILGSVLTYSLNAISLNLVVSREHIRTGEAYFESFGESAEGSLWWGRYLVGTGAVCTAFSSILVNMLCAPRILYALSTDGLFLQKPENNDRTTRFSTPETVVIGIILCFITMFIKVAGFEQFQSAGILCTYIMVTAGIIILKYSPIVELQTTKDLSKHDSDDITRLFENENSTTDHRSVTTETEDSSNDYVTSWIEPSDIISITERPDTAKAYLETELARLLPYSDEDNDSNNNIQDKNRENKPGELKGDAHNFFQPLGRFEPGTVVATCLLASVAFQVGTIAVVTHVGVSVYFKSKFWLVIQTLLFALSMTCVIPIYQYQKRIKQKGTFEVPCVPTLPLISIFINIIFIFQLPPTTWIRSLLWMIVGLIVYFVYGYNHSSMNYRKRDKQKITLTHLQLNTKPCRMIATYQQLYRNPEPV